MTEIKDGDLVQMATQRGNAGVGTVDEVYTEDGVTLVNVCWHSTGCVGGPYTLDKLKLAPDQQ